MKTLIVLITCLILLSACGSKESRSGASLEPGPGDLLLARADYCRTVPSWDHQRYSFGELVHGEKPYRYTYGHINSAGSV